MTTSPATDSAATLLDRLHPKSQQAVVLAELEALYARCEAQGVCAADAEQFLRNKFALEGFARWVDTSPKAST